MQMVSIVPYFPPNGVNPTLEAWFCDRCKQQKLGKAAQATKFHSTGSRMILCPRSVMATMRDSDIGKGKEKLSCQDFLPNKATPAFLSPPYQSTLSHGQLIWTSYLLITQKMSRSMISEAQRRPKLLFVSMLLSQWISHLQRL